MSFVRAIIGALVGGTLGAVVWVAIGQFTGYEYGFVAVLIGFLSGWFVQKACAEYEITVVHGIIASICAITAIVGAKYSLLSSDIKAARESIENVELERDEMIACVAENLMQKIRQNGQKDESADGEVEVSSAPRVEYPESVYRVAAEMWDQLIPAEREKYFSQAREFRATSMGFDATFFSKSIDELAQDEFKNCFSTIDFVWFALAVGAAFKYGSTDPCEYDDDEDDDYEYDDELEEDVEVEA